MERVGLSPRLGARLPRELSGGQRQRISIARALSARPQVLIADEAVSSSTFLFGAIAQSSLDLQAELNLTLIFISHDLSVIDHLCDRVAVMYLGRIIEIGQVANVLGRGAHPYTRALVAAVPSTGRRQPTDTAVASRRIAKPHQSSLRLRIPHALSDRPTFVRNTQSTNHHGRTGPLTACHFAVTATPVPA